MTAEQAHQFVSRWQPKQLASGKAELEVCRGLQQRMKGLMICGVGFLSLTMGTPDNVFTLFAQLGALGSFCFALYMVPKTGEAMRALEQAAIVNRQS